MPRKTDLLALNDPFFKKSVKLLPCQKEMVKHWYDKGISITKIAKDFKVSKRLIQFILFPERHTKNLQDRKERGGTMIYYDKEKHTKAIREHREYKKQVLNDTTRSNK
jgi:predicted DNA-binding protein YlxM (UPF0122 family)